MQPQHLWQWHTSHKSWHWFSFRSQDSLQGSRHCEKEKGVSSSKNQPHQSVSAVEMVPTCGGLTGTSLRHFPYHLCSNQTHHFLLRIMAKPSKGANSPLQKQIWEKVCLSGAGCLLKTLAWVLLGVGLDRFSLHALTLVASHAVYASFSSCHFPCTCLGLIHFGTGTKLPTCYHAEQRAFNKWYTWFNVPGIPFFNMRNKFTECSKSARDKRKTSA